MFKKIKVNKKDENGDDLLLYSIKKKLLYN